MNGPNEEVTVGQNVNKETLNHSPVSAAQVSYLDNFYLLYLNSLTNVTAKMYAHIYNLA